MISKNRNQEQANQYTREEEQEIALQIAQGNVKVRASFIENNLGLAKSFAISYVNRYQFRTLTLNDLIQEASIGLTQAVDRFDGTKGCKFSTYASYWIKKAINEAILTQEKGISLSVRKSEKVRKMKGVEANLEKELNRKPSLVELAKESKIRQSEIEEIYQYQFDTVSLNELMDNDETKEKGDILSLAEPSIEEFVLKSSMKRIMEDLIENSKLTETEKKVVKLYYESNMTYREIGQVLGFGKQTSKNKLEAALMKFRKRRDIKSCAIYMDNPNRAEENIDFFRNLYQNPKYRGRTLEKLLPKESKKR